MRRVLFGLWLVVSLVGLFVIGGLLHEPVFHFGSPSSLLVAAIWLVGVVPLSFSFWFRVQRTREQQLVDEALQSWRAGKPGAGALVARALEFALAEEDEDSLRRLLDVLARSAPAPLSQTLEPFMKAASEWLSDDGGHSSRDEHLERLKVSAASLLPQLSASA